MNSRYRPEALLLLDDNFCIVLGHLPHHRTAVTHSEPGSKPPHGDSKPINSKLSRRRHGSRIAADKVSVAVIVKARVGEEYIGTTRHAYNDRERAASVMKGRAEAGHANVALQDGFH